MSQDKWLYFVGQQTSLLSLFPVYLSSLTACCFFYCARGVVLRGFRCRLFAVGLIGAVVLGGGLYSDYRDAEALRAAVFALHSGSKIDLGANDAEIKNLEVVRQIFIRTGRIERVTSGDTKVIFSPDSEDVRARDGVVYGEAVINLALQHANFQQKRLAHSALLGMLVGLLVGLVERSRRKARVAQR